jgi:hypothetical protein
MREDLRQRLVAKYWEMVELLAADMLPKNPKDKRQWKHMLRNGPAKRGVPSMEAYLEKVPDDKFEAVMAVLDSTHPAELMRGVFKTGLDRLPKKRGGRPAMFSLDVRRRAVQDIGNELPRCDRLSDAVKVVAARYGMPTEYLRKLWKNRKRLRSREL